MRHGYFAGWTVRWLTAGTILLCIASGCAKLPDNSALVPTTVISATEQTHLATLFADDKKQHPGQSGFYLLDNGLDAFVARAVLVLAAEKSIDLQYYLYHPDLVGGLLADLLLQAADRGVRVRLLLDDMGLEGRDINLFTIAQHPNISVRIFNPFIRGSSRVSQFITRFGSVTRRMHNKSLTIDNQATIVGGRNIGNEYFAADPELAFGDMDVLAIGPVVNEISNSFDSYWNNPLSYPVELISSQKPDLEALERARPLLDAYTKRPEAQQYVQALNNSQLARELKNDVLPFSWGKAVAVYDDPEKITAALDAKDLHLATQLNPLVNELSSEFLMLSAYFVPGKEGVDFFKKLQSQGVQVRILTNSLASTDVAVVHCGYAKYRKELLRAGVELYEVAIDALPAGKKKQQVFDGASRTSLHAKSYIFDRQILFIGSFNFDPRSADQNTELGIVFDSPELGRKIGKRFDERKSTNVYQLRLVPDNYGGEDVEWVRKEGGREVVRRVEPDTSFFKRLLVSVMALLPIESQL